MKLANVDGRAVIVTAEGAGIDVELASQGKFGPDLPGIYENWREFGDWADTVSAADARVEFERSRLGSPSPQPRQIVAVGLNYREHADETGFARPDSLPPVFTKFASSLTGPDCTVVLPEGGNTDWEVELVAVIGAVARNVAPENAWGHVAGLAVGQDISERTSQMAGPAPQFSLAKSFPNFAPVGPWLVTPDEVPDKDDLELGCAIDGTVVQQARTRDLIFPVADLIAKLSATITLFPGDLVFTGTPAGVGFGRTPQRFLRPGEQLRTWIEGIGELHQTFTAATVETA